MYDMGSYEGKVFMNKFTKLERKKREGTAKGRRKPLKRLKVPLFFLLFAGI